MARLWIPLLVLLGLSFGPSLGVNVDERQAHAAKSRTSIAGIPLPPRARIQDDGTYRAAQSYRKTVVYFERYLRRQGIPHKRVPTYQVRGVLVARFLSDSPRSQWLAIHVYRIRGMTHVFIVPRSVAPRAQKNEPSSKE